ncbi:MBL fold metallo-hydrolase [Candidatus Woesearchaeota archaeon]|nr:MBL fold metallo-hydrolase [Candidatus Woesearchaeota archaeon]
MFGKISDDVWKFTGCSDKSNVYFIDSAKKIIIDTGNRTDREHLKNFLGRAIDFEKIDVVVFTHLHYDHCGNFDLFPNAEMYASSDEITAFKNNPDDTVLDAVVAEKFSSVYLKPLPAEFLGLKVVETPGHTSGSVCLWYEKDKILFTGDTLFGNKMQGRVDLPTSMPDEMKNSIMRLIEIPYKVIAPGHDY